MRRFSALLALALTLSIFAQPAPDRVERWREDLQAFSDILHGTKTAYTRDFPPGQMDLQKLYPHLDRDLEALRAEISKLRDGQVHLEIQRILATAHVAHNSVYFPESSPRLPISVEWLEDGPVIIAAAAEYKAAVATRIVKVGPLTSVEFLDAISPYISYETEGWRRVKAASILPLGVLLESVKVTHDGVVDLTLEDGTRSFVLPMAVAPPGVKQLGLHEATGWPTLVVQGGPGSNYYWGRFLADANTFCIQYDQCTDDPAQPFSQFLDKTFAEIDASHAKRVIVDLRFNTGGSSRTSTPWWTVSRPDGRRSAFLTS